MFVPKKRKRTKQRIHGKKLGFESNRFFYLNGPSSNDWGTTKSYEIDL